MRREGKNGKKCCHGKKKKRKHGKKKKRKCRLGGHKKFWIRAHFSCLRRTRGNKARMKKCYAKKYHGCMRREGKNGIKCCHGKKKKKRKHGKKKKRKCKLGGHRRFWIRAHFSCLRRTRGNMARRRSASMARRRSASAGSVATKSSGSAH